MWLPAKYKERFELHLIETTLPRKGLLSGTDGLESAGYAKKLIHRTTQGGRLALISQKI